MSAESRLARRQQRRRTPLPDHGERARYQIGCRCTACSAANTAYELAWERGERRDGAQTVVRATLARKRLRQLQIEGFTLAMVAIELGVKQLRSWRLGPRVTRRRQRQLEDLYQRRVAE